MKRNALTILILFSLSVFTSCSLNYNSVEAEDIEASNLKAEPTKTEPHRYGGWYCPDNLNGFPAVDIADWQNVPVVNGRMATKEETQNGTSLIFVDKEKYPNARHLDMKMPRLASFFNRNTDREELIIIIQAIHVDNDSIVGFRYLNGGNGSAKLDEVTLLSEAEISRIPSARFVTHKLEINTSRDPIWEVLTKPEYTKSLQPIFDKNNKLEADWRKTTNVNFHYSKSGNPTSSFGDILFGNFYIQNDYDNQLYNEKFLLLENSEKKTTELIIVCGPYFDNFEEQKNILTKWAQKVKELSEKE